MSGFDIDFVILWVDGSDPAWRAEKAKYSPAKGVDDAGIRYRDWGLLKYWFRGVARFAPWVRRVHFITWGHVPPWLDVSHPKLRIVRHGDYIPPEYLPTFSSQPIELNMHRIDDLAERFVLFNDDTFLTKPAKRECFFADNGLPRDSAVLSPVIVTQKRDIGTIALNNMGVINTHFTKRGVVKANMRKFYNPIYGAQLLRTLCLTPWRHFPGFFNDHIPLSLLKSTLNDVWEAEPELMREVSARRFRSYSEDINIWLMRYWQFCTGNFVPISLKRGKDLQMALSDTPDIIRSQRYTMICINDSEDITDFGATQAAYEAAFKAILPERCEYELPSALSACP